MDIGREPVEDSRVPSLGIGREPVEGSREAYVLAVHRDRQWASSM